MMGRMQSANDFWKKRKPDKEFFTTWHYRLEEVKRKGYRAGLNGERCKQYTETMRSGEEVSVFTQAFVFGMNERRLDEERRKKEAEANVR